MFESFFFYFPISEPLLAVGEIEIAFIRTLRALTLEEVSNSINMGKSYYSKIENNKLRPNLVHLERIASVLNISVSLLLFLSEEEDRFPDLGIKKIMESNLIKI